MISKNKIIETSLVLTTGFVVLYFLFGKPFLLVIAFIIGFAGIFMPFLAKYVAIAWFKLADAMNFVMSKIILGLVFFILLVPLAFAYKTFGKDKLNLKKGIGSNWVIRNKNYTASDMENIW